MFVSLYIIINILPLSYCIHRDLYLFDDPIDLSDYPADSPPPDPFISINENNPTTLPSLDDSNEEDASTSPLPIDKSVDELTEKSIDLKQRDNRGISSTDDIIDVPALESIDSYSSPLSSNKYASSDSYSSSPSSSDQYSSLMSHLSSLHSSLSEPGAIIETGRFRLISSKLLKGPSVPTLNGPSVIQQAAYGAYPTAGYQQSYATAPSYASSYLPSSAGSNYYGGYNNGYGQDRGYGAYPTAPSQGYGSSYNQGYNSGYTYRLNSQPEGRRVIIYKKILRPVRIHTTVERLPGGKVVDQWAEGGFSNDLLKGRSNIDAPLFTPTQSGGFYPVSGQ